MKWILPIVLQIALIVLNAIFAMAEIAVISISDARLQKMQSEGNRKAGRLLRLKSEPAKFLATIQVAITLAGFMGSAFAAENFAPDLALLLEKFLEWDREVLESISVVVITLVLSYLSLIFGELVPKRVAMRKSEKISIGLAGAVFVVSKFFAPIVWLLTLSTNAVLRLLGIDPDASTEEVSEEDILMMAEVGAETGAIEEDERELIENIFEFDDMLVGEIITHRTDVAILWENESDQEWENTIRSSRYTMYPVCGESIDHVIGVLNTKDYFRLETRDRKTVMEKAVRAPYFVPVGAKTDVTFRNMKQKRESFAVVLDEYAGFAGILSMKDLVSCILGEISQEGEEAKEEEILPNGERSWRIRGNPSLVLTSKVIGIEFPDEYDTFSGFVLGLYGSIPTDGTSFRVEWEGIEILVNDVQEHQVSSAVINLPEVPQEEEE